ncbi:TIGR04283 family arsenosugar biosynthesis glycosyltransferase [Ruegeria arenilitoris]|uniref:TIGR04283 family arsenosugar biosynthesis glycosyltransferase n=1 Tax=Ruegeria arenilitoris TaxID=1173585 RepID=UPI00147F4446|nr:TIGR04283 family arsenosugar biosynthesis glycosyltransferase [Ruegeria arenilitoris]
MTAPISIVIPTLNAGAELPATLQALFEGVQAGLIHELIISDGGSTDSTIELADQAGAVIVAGAASRGGQLRRGCDPAKGEWLLILHADTRLQEGWSEVVADHLPLGHPATFRLRFRATGFGPAWVAGWANLRSRLFALPYGDQGLLVRRQDYCAAGGFPDQPLMEDVALVRALPRVTVLDADAVTNAERYIHHGWLRRGARNLWVLAQYFLGADTEQLAQKYRR